MTDQHAHLRVFIPEAVGITYNPKDNTWIAMAATSFDFSKARSKCKVCFGQGRSGYADFTWNRGPGKILVVCPKCYPLMKIPEQPAKARVGWIGRLIAWIAVFMRMLGCALGKRKSPAGQKSRGRNFPLY